MDLAKGFQKLDAQHKAELWSAVPKTAFEDSEGNPRAIDPHTHRIFVGFFNAAWISLAFWGLIAFWVLS